MYKTVKHLDVFFRSSAMLLMGTAAAKLYSSTGSARILRQTDLLVHIPLRTLMIAIACVELVVAAILFWSQSLLTRAAVLLWLSGNFIIYRLANHALGITYCSCLGTIGERLPVPQPYLNAALTTFVLLWFLGSGYILWRAWSERQEAAVEATIYSQRR